MLHMNIYTVTIVLQTVFLRVKSRSDERWIVDGRGSVAEDGSAPPMDELCRRDEIVETVVMLVTLDGCVFCARNLKVRGRW